MQMTLIEINLIEMNIIEMNKIIGLCNYYSVDSHRKLYKDSQVSMRRVKQ